MARDPVRSPFHYSARKVGTLEYYPSHVKPGFLLGPVEGRNWLYYPAVLWLKTSVPCTFVLALGLGAAVLHKIRLPDWSWAVPSVYLVLLLGAYPFPSLRHTLGLFPCFLLVVAGGAGWLYSVGVSSGRTGVVVLPAFLLSWHAGSSIASFPHHLSYLPERSHPQEGKGPVARRIPFGPEPGGEALGGNRGETGLGSGEAG